MSKQTLYKEFTDKASLFRELVLDIGNQVDASLFELPEPDTIEDVDAWIETLALRWALTIMAPTVQRIRRLVIAEAPRFPDGAASYWEGGFERAIKTLADHFRGLAAAGRLAALDPEIAAQHFAGLLLWIPSNRTTFSAHPDVVTDKELRDYARAGAAAFRRAYAPAGPLGAS